MANASTIRRQIAGTQQLTLAPNTFAADSSTETAFQLNNNGLTLTGGGVTPLSAGVTGLYQGTGQVLSLHAAGTIITTQATNLTLKLYQVAASALPIANTLAGAQAVTATGWSAVLGTSGALAVGAQTAGTWTFDAELQLDTNGILRGQFTAQIDNNTTVAWQALSNTATLTGEADLNFVITSTLSASGSIVTMSEFALALI